MISKYLLSLGAVIGAFIYDLVKFRGHLLEIDWLRIVFIGVFFILLVLLIPEELFQKKQKNQTNTSFFRMTKHR